MKVVNRKRERQLETAFRLPPLHPADSASLDFRRVLAERERLGVERLTDKQLKEISQIGYDAYFLKRMNSYSKIGLKSFHRLAALGRVELTTEFIIFHALREQLQNDCRRRIAILLSSKTREAAMPESGHGKDESQEPS